MKMIDGFDFKASPEIIDFTEKNLGVTFPSGFISCIRQCDRGVPEKPIIRFKDPVDGVEEKVEIGSFMSFNPSYKSNILKKYFFLPSFFPKTFIPFATIGNGDYIGFDYSVGGFEDPSPPVVYWIHDNPEGKEIADIAINFEEFLNKLEPEEEADF